MANEGALAKKIKDYLIGKGCYVENIWGGGFQAAGIPDLIGCYRGIFIGLEVKLDYNKPSEIQKAKIELINKAGGYAIVAYSVDDARDLLKKIDKEEFHNAE